MHNSEYQIIANYRKLCRISLDIYHAHIQVYTIFFRMFINLCYNFHLSDYQVYK